MIPIYSSINTFNNEFDLTTQDMSVLTIKETNSKDNCYIWDSNLRVSYDTFILSKNTKSKIVCSVVLFKSSHTNKYIPRLTFKRLNLNNYEQLTKSERVINITFSTSDDAQVFWKFIGFLSSYKEIVDLGEFDKSLKIVPKDSYILEFQQKEHFEKIKDLKELIAHSSLSSDDIKLLIYEERKKNIRGFFYLLKNLKNSHQAYKAKFEINVPGEECIWHHFLKNNDWILGLNADLKFTKDLYDEQKVGIEDGDGLKSPKTDFLGISDYTLIIELKHGNTKIFKDTKSKGRTNTWDFTSDFIEGISQCLGQKFELEKSYDHKNFVKEGNRLDKNLVENIDPKSLFIVGNKKIEFSTTDLNDVNLLKNKTFERFRRNNRNVEILTYDELFERAYHIVFSKKLVKNWFEKTEQELFD